ncbi:hypothetical protein SERLADRAFT_467412 [Serpula lacrymans var. lacrymans S7.9]|nr:uncharacterized protein SERLADRAFT_467412 [Serpula lacrymans var. lacrymans S7.9]EGO24316.1 hypothetical protein SERLADRAFT_467412 [Serpula lacrymans var. lacrymans S7.9]
MPIVANAHPDRKIAEGQHSDIHHPPPQDHTEDPQASKDIPETGWTGEIPSKNGGDYEKNWMHQPPYQWKSEGDKFKTNYISECWCGNVSFEFHGEPVDAKHCHCHQCQRLHGAPFQWAVIFPKTSVRLLRNQEDSLHCFSTQTRNATHHVPCKVSCNVCRSPIFDEGRNTVLAYPSSFRFPDQHIPLHFQPSCHIFYKQR